MSFANQFAVITGASSGIGWALAKALAAEGCKVGLVARRRSRLEQLADQIASSGGTAATAAADVGDRSQVGTAIEALAACLGPVDLLIANAGVGAPTTVDPLNVADVETQLRVNTLGVVYAIEAVLPDMLARGRGHLAAVSSLAAYVGLPGEAGYCASKAAVNVFMDGLRIQLRDRGIAVTTICPGFVKTPMTAVNDFHMPFVLEADEAARRIVRALRRRRKVYNFPWQTSWLMALARWVPDLMLARGMRSYNEAPPMPAVPLTETPPDEPAPRDRIPAP
ncbi:MAG TPA: SDR family NAD(P)-dependent oxidoreductase [Gemmataceae bacterium]|nr:SDR family NAD(P)-dependent oxidoreductase [Gemmataceae bacterium]